MGFIAGFPTILGSMIGFVAYSQAIGSLFFSVGGGSLLYVIVQLVRLAYMASSAERAFLGVVLGMILMYLTGILVSMLVLLTLSRSSAVERRTVTACLYCFLS